MLRHGFAIKVKEGKTAVFRKNLGAIWSELTIFLDMHRMVNFRLWNGENIVFGYYETDHDFIFSCEDKGMGVTT